MDGELFTWGEGDYGRLGIVSRIRKCAYRISKLDKFSFLLCALAKSIVAKVFSRPGHGTTGTLKIPTKVQNIEPIRLVDCGASHTLCLSMDSVRVWSFGAGDSGKLGHGDTNRQLLPKVFEE